MRKNSIILWVPWNSLATLLTLGKAMFSTACYIALDLRETGCPVMGQLYDCHFSSHKNNSEMARGGQECKERVELHEQLDDFIP